MILFFFKKTFFDGWDNLFPLVLLNIVFSLLVGGEASLAWILLSARNGQPISIAEILVLVAGFALVSVYSGACVSAVTKMADFEKMSAWDFFNGLKKTAGKSALFSLLVSLLVCIFAIGFKYYAATGGFIGILAGCLLFWFALACALSLQFFFPAMARLKGNFPKLLKKCFLIALDNPGFALFQLFWGGLLALASLFIVGLVPGPAGMQLALCDALRLRLYKYDWLDANPGANRRKVPWKELLEADEDMVGKRTLRSMIFPWKEDQK